MRSAMRLAVLAIGMAAVGLISIGMPSANAGVSYERVRLWMLPPADALGNNACLTNRWHSGSAKALDWKATCGSSGPELVRFRALAANIDATNDGTYYPWMYGRNTNYPPYTCPGSFGLVHEGRVQVWSYSGLLKGHLVLAHSVLYNAAEFNINAKNGGSLTNAYLTSVGVGDTVKDVPGTVFSACWQGWHVHESNSTGGFSTWDSWHNSLYDTAATMCDCYQNNSSSNWTRRLTWEVTNGP